MIRLLKKVVPFKVKYILWWIFKSPQRKNGIIKTLYLDIISLIMTLLNPKKIKTLSICTGIGNRWDSFFEFVLPSIIEMKEFSTYIEISIHWMQKIDNEDYAESIRKEYEKKIKKMWGGKVLLTFSNDNFTRSKSFNKAIIQSNSDLIFRCDADMTLPNDLVFLCSKYTNPKTNYYPICFWLEENRPAKIQNENGYWRFIGPGMFSSTKQNFLTINGFDENFTTWGGEDWDLFHRFYQNRIGGIRKNCNGLFHHWHQSEERK